LLGHLLSGILTDLLCHLTVFALPYSGTDTSPVNFMTSDLLIMKATEI